MNINYDDDLKKQAEQFWSVESYKTKKSYDKENMTKEEKKAIKNLKTTTTKRGNLYKDGLLWKENNPILNYNKGMAVDRFHLTERKLTKNNELAIKYKNTINEYISKGYARKLFQEEAIEHHRSPTTSHTMSFKILTNLES